MQPGDKITLSLSPPVALTRFTILKAHVSVTRTADESGKVDVDDMQRELRHLYFRCLKQEIELMTETMAQITGDDTGDDIEKLLDYCAAQIGDQHVRVETEQRNGEARGTPRRIVRRAAK